MGAIASGNITYFNHGIIEKSNIGQIEVDQVIAAERQELDRRESVYRGNRPFPNIEKKTVILVDDGVATGATLQVAIAALKKREPGKIILAVPLAPKETLLDFMLVVDEIYCLHQMVGFHAVGRFYEYFSQTTDDEVVKLLN